MYLANGTFNNNIVETYSTQNNTVTTYGIGDVPEEEPIILSNNTNKIESLKTGAKIHKAIRRYIRPYLKPGLKLSTLANLIEDKCKELTKENGINKGIGFPSSLSVDDCAAHFTPSSEYDITMTDKSITKIDFGVEVNGWIVDSAFTVAFNDDYIELLKGVKDATYTGIKNAGMDVVIKDWGRDIMEVMESYEVQINNKTFPIQVLQNLGGHNILKNRIHGEIFLPAAYIHYYPDNLRFTEGIYAIETFGSTKSNWVVEKEEMNTIYMNKSLTSSKIRKDKNLTNSYNNLLKKFYTLPYCDRYIDIIHKPKIKKLIEKNIVTPYPPLYCKKNGYTAQFEHTVAITEDKKIIFSQSTDY